MTSPFDPIPAANTASAAGPFDAQNRATAPAPNPTVEAIKQLQQSIDQLAAAQEASEEQLAALVANSNKLLSHDLAAVRPVTVRDITMSFGSMVVFMVKWAIAAVPALIFLFILGAVASLFFAMMMAILFHR